MTNYVDCGQCPRISTGCVEGQCLRSKPESATFNISLSSPYDKNLGNWNKRELLFVLYWSLYYITETLRETLLTDAVKNQSALSILSLPENIKTVGDFFDYAENISNPVE